MIYPGFIVADGMSCFACTIDLRYVNVKRDGGKMIFCGIIYINREWLVHINVCQITTHHECAESESLAVIL